MSAITNTQAAKQDEVRDDEGQMNVVAQVLMMTKRSLYTLARQPSVIIPGLIISAFFLLVYEASLGEASGFIPDLAGKSYLGFILPISVVSTALNSVSGQAIVRDLESGYFDKLLLTPINRSALLLGPIIAGSLVLLLQTSLIVGIALLMGLTSETGVLGILIVLGFAMLLGTGFSGFTVGVALRSGNSGATQAATFLFFPLTFLTSTFVPIELLGDWLQVAARINPITYVLDAMRSLLIEGWDAEVLLIGLLACSVLAIVPFIFALLGLRYRTARK